MASIPTSWRVWSWSWSRGLKPYRLQRHALQGWQLRQGRAMAFSQASVQHIWQTPWWLTITFDCHNPASRYQFTAWRCGQTEQGWRSLCVWALRDLTLASSEAGAGVSP